MTIGTIFSITLIFVFFVLLVLTLYKKKKSLANIYFALVIFCSLFWTLSNLMVDISASNSSILFWSKLTLLGPTLIPLFFLQFTHYFPEKTIPNKFTLFFFYFSTALIIILVPTKFNIEHVEKLASGIPMVTTGPLYYIFGVYFALSMVIAIYNLVKSYFKFFGIIRLQVKYILIGISGSVIFGFIANFLLLIAGESQYANLGPYFTLFFIVTTSYAIVRYRLMNIRLILARSLLYFLLVASVASFFSFSLIYLFDQFLQDAGRYSKMSLILLSSFIVVIALDPLKRLLAKITDDIFYKDKIDYQNVLREISIIIAKEIDLDVLLSSLRSALTYDLKLKAVDILVKRGDHFGSLTGASAGKKFPPDSDLIEHLKEKQEIIITDEMYRRTADMQESDERQRAQQVLDELERQGIEFCVPVYLEGQLKAVIILGQKQSGDIYGSEEIDFFKSLAPQVAVAIEKSQLYESIGEFNLKLQDKINIATKKLKETNLQLQDANAHLKQLDTAKSEFLSIASHQLRTPISALKGYLSMLLEGDFGKVPDKQRQIIADLFESASRLARLINIFLNVSRIESGRFKLDRTVVDVNALVENVLKELQGQFVSKKLSVSFTPAKNMRKLYVDSDKVREVILNLIDNAIKYTPQGSIAISTYEEKNDFHFVCTDTGIGIRPDDARALFRKFVRGTGIAQVNTQGSGLGLYIAQRVVTEHGGRIWVESKGLDKGSSFNFVLPIVTLDPLEAAKAEKGATATSSKQTVSAKKKI